MVLVDSNVIIDIFTEDVTWFEWSRSALRTAADRDNVAINPIIYAEVASGFATMSKLDQHLGSGTFRRLELPYEAGFIRRPRFCRISEARRRSNVTVARLLHRSSCRGARPRPTDARLTALRHILPEAEGHLPNQHLLAPPVNYNISVQFNAAFPQLCLTFSSNSL